MKMKSIAFGAALLGGLLSTAAFATTTEAHDIVTATVAQFVKPAPLKVVTPTGLSRVLVGVTLRLRLTIDAAGQPHDVKVVGPHEDRLTRGVVSAVAQWQFTPALENGVPVSVRAELPLQLTDS